MRDAIFAYEPFIRLGAFGSILAAMAIWELVGPRRKQAIGRLMRWPNNLGVVVVDTLLVRLVIPTTAVGLALVAQAHAWGLFNTIALPAWIAVVCSVILLDLAIYFQHVLFHAVPRAVAATSHASCRPRIRRHHRTALPSDRDCIVDGDQAGRGRRPGGARGGGADLRSGAQRHLHVQPRQHPHPTGIRPRAALVRRDAGHAPS